MSFLFPHSLPTIGGRRTASAGTLLLLPMIIGFPQALAAETAAPVPGISFATMLQTFAGLALILALFVGAALLIRRLNGGRGLLADSGPMRIVASLPLGPRERIVLIEIENTWLVVGICPGQINTLQTMAKGTLPPTANAGEGQFAHWLRQFRESASDAKN